MAQQAAVQLDDFAQHLFQTVDALDIEALSGLITDDCEFVDEISRGWMRGRAPIEGYFAKVKTMISNPRTKVRDVSTRDFGDTAVVTFVIEQTYMLGGQEERITAPTSLTLRRAGSEWRIAVLHSVPLSEASQG